MDASQRRHASPSSDLASRAVIAGFAATGAMSVAFVFAYLAAVIFGSPDGGLVSTWLWHLGHNAAVSASLSLRYVAIGIHLGVGLALALLYAKVVEPALPGPAWMRGFYFALLPWGLSVFVLLPALGGGYFGLALGAGPLPAVGSLVVHLVYGATLGATYSICPDWCDDLDRAADDCVYVPEGSLALGIVAGGAAGAIAGLLATAYLGLGGISSGGAGLLTGGLLGSALGAVVGPLLGLARCGSRSERAPGSDLADDSVRVRGHAAAMRKRPARQSR